MYKALKNILTVFEIALAVIALAITIVSSAQAHGNLQQHTHITLCDTLTNQQFDLMYFMSSRRIYGTTTRKCDTDVRVIGQYDPTTQTATLTTMEGAYLSCSVSVFMLTLQDKYPPVFAGGSYTANNYYNDNITLTIGECNDNN